MTRRFGPTRGAGVAVVEKPSEKQIVPGALGVTAYTGIMQKGPVGKAFRAKTKTEFLFKGGDVIAESLLPNTALSFYKASNGAGELWFNRVTDGSEKKSFVSLYNRLNTGTLVAKFEAGNGGRWGGKKQQLVDEYSGVTATTLTLANAPANLKDDELAGGLLKLKAVPGQSFKILSNTTAGVLTFAGDTDLVDAIDGSANALLEVVLENAGASLAVLVKDGLLSPSTKFGLEFYLVEGGVTSLEKNFDDLSIDPDDDDYFVNIINSDSESDFVIKATDLNLAGSKVAGQRPSNYASEILALTAVQLTAQVSYVVLNSAAGAKMKIASAVLGAEAIRDTLTLTNTAAGARAEEILTFGANAANDETLEVGGVVYTWKAVVADPLLEILIGGTVEGSIDNLVAFLNAQSPSSFGEKDSATIAHVHARTAGTAGNALTLVSSDANVVASGATLTGGTAQTWDMVSTKMSFLGTIAVVSGVAQAASNDFGYGFTLEDSTLDSSKEWAPADTLTVKVEPFEKDAMIGGFVYPDESDSRKKFEIISNDGDKITVKAGSDMTTVGSVGGTYRSQFIQDLAEGYDGIAGVDDTDYQNAYDTGTSPLLRLRGKNLGLVKLATPAITSSAVQKAGAAFAGSQNWQYRYEIPANITNEVDAEEYINATLGRNDFAKTTWPSFYKIANAGGGLKLVSATGGIHGVEARIAADFEGFHKAAAGTDAIIAEALELPDGMGDDREPLDEEFLNPQGINILKFKDGNLILWGDRTVGIDPAFKFAHQREYLSHIENVFLENFDFIIFSLNSSESGTDQLLFAAFIQFFTPELAKGAIVGKDVVDATQLKIDGENNTDATRATGDLFADMSIKIVDTVERFTIRVSKRGVNEQAA